MQYGPSRRFIHFFRRKKLHDSNQLSLPSVFGPAPEHSRKGPPIRDVFSDIACIIDAHLRVHDPDVLNHVLIRLGQVHKVTVLIDLSLTQINAFLVCICSTSTSAWCNTTASTSVDLDGPVRKTLKRFGEELLILLPRFSTWVP